MPSKRPKLIDAHDYGYTGSSSTRHPSTTPAKAQQDHQNNVEKKPTPANAHKGHQHNVDKKPTPANAHKRNQDIVEKKAIRPFLSGHAQITTGDVRLVNDAIHHMRNLVNLRVPAVHRPLDIRADKEGFWLDFGDSKDADAHAIECAKELRRGDFRGALLRYRLVAYGVDGKRLEVPDTPAENSA